MAFPIKTCSLCGEQFELKPDKPGFANRCPDCTESEAAGTTCVPHSPFFGPGYLATIQLLAAKERASALERFYCDLAFDPCGRFAPITGGFIDIPEGPGLGGDPDMDLIDRYRA